MTEQGDNQGAEHQDSAPPEGDNPDNNQPQKPPPHHLRHVLGGLLGGVFFIFIGYYAATVNTNEITPLWAFMFGSPAGLETNNDFAGDAWFFGGVISGTLISYLRLFG